MIRDMGHQMVIDSMNTMDIRSVMHVCNKMGVEIIVEDGKISDYEFTEKGLKNE